MVLLNHVMVQILRSVKFQYNTDDYFSYDQHLFHKFFVNCSQWRYEFKRLLIGYVGSVFWVDCAELCWKRIKGLCWIQMGQVGWYETSAKHSYYLISGFVTFMAALSGIIQKICCHNSKGHCAGELVNALQLRSSMVWKAKKEWWPGKMAKGEKKEMRGLKPRDWQQPVDGY